MLLLLPLYHREEEDGDSRSQLDKWSKVYYYYYYYYYTTMGLFDSVDSTQGLSFAFGLAPLNSASLESEEFVPSSRLSIFIYEEGVINADGQLKLYTEKDPIDCATEPSFSKDNLFVKGLSKALPAAVPVGGIVLWQKYIDWLPEPLTSLSRFAPVPGGFVLCDGSVYELPNGKDWKVPRLSPPTDSLEEDFDESSLLYIQRLPEGAKLVLQGAKLVRQINRRKDTN